MILNGFSVVHNVIVTEGKVTAVEKNTPKIAWKKYTFTRLYVVFDQDTAS